MSLTELQKEYSFMNDMQQKAVFQTEGPVLILAGAGSGKTTVLVKGYKADVLERHLASNNVIFLRNEDYATTHMFDSVRIGLEYLKDKVDTVLFTPVDVPLFTARTVTQMLSADHPLVTPVCEGKPGHPILLRSSLIDSILKDDGSSGLEGAV